ncbi:DUF934 domain-containing protein [Azospirillum sp. SYSU D00513]|uniref:DUF934 domain-containing protein n=1 Tax=Azospirillum sp. SYSU D00513 TaxID=2812561 RepID=UPI001A959A57|nr:DUF934 domain-containing protein [Azospirillum sp. SYSU D00513]
MPLLKNGDAVEDNWAVIADDAPVPADRPAVISLDRWQAERASFDGRNAPLGVRLKSSQLVDTVLADLDRFSLVAIEFPKFRDGRGFSTGRLLRERHGYQGEIRAVGHVIPDQYLFLKRCGFDTVEAPEGTNLDSWKNALTEMTVAYQPAVGDDQPLSLLRRRLAQQG